MDAIENLKDAHTTAFGQEPKLAVAAPGRVNLLGGHTDYNDGYVLPMAIERVVRVTASPRPDRKMGLFALDLDERAEIDLDALEPGDERGWVDYPAGVLSELLDAGAPVTGLNLTISGDLPQGAGLASSAAMVVACGLAACELCGWSLGRKELARLAQRAEHEFAGVLCGIMDQLVACLAEAGTALFIDCRSLETSPVPLGGGHLQVVVTDSGVEHELPASAYNQRRAQCREGVAILSRRFEGQALRDLFDDWLLEHRPLRRKKVLSRLESLRGGALNDPRSRSNTKQDPDFRRISATCPRASRKTIGDRPWEP